MGYLDNTGLAYLWGKIKEIIPKKLSELTNDSSFITAAEAPVQSVNGKTGEITLGASDVSALPASTTYVSAVDGASGKVTTNAVKTTTQSLTDTQKAQARANIGAGTSSFSGSYLDLADRPSIPSKTSELTNDSGFVTSDHTHDASDIASGTVPIARGGTGASDAATARANLGAAAESHTHAAGDITSGTFSADRYADKGIARSKLADDAIGTNFISWTGSVFPFTAENNGSLLALYISKNTSFELTDEVASAFPQGYRITIYKSNSGYYYTLNFAVKTFCAETQSFTTGQSVTLKWLGDTVTCTKIDNGNWIIETNGRKAFTNVSVASSAFVSDTTYTDFPYRASVALNGVTSSMFPEVVFSVSDAMSGVFAPAAQTYDGGVYIYANAQKAVTIPTILAWR